MEQNKRLTRARCNGIKIGYWSMARKDELVQRLGKYEDVCEDPDELRRQIAELEHRIDELIDPQAAQEYRRAEQERIDYDIAAAYAKLI